MSKNLELQLHLVHDEKIDFGSFVAATRVEFRKMALYLVRRWTPPEWFTLEDIEQELYLGAWKYIWRFDPTRGKSISNFVTYNAIQHAKTALHVARGVTISGSPDRKVSNIETPLSMFGEEGDGEALMSVILGEAPQAEEALIEHEDRKAACKVALRACESQQERYVVLAIREAKSVDGASRVLYDDIDNRIDLRLSSEAHAERFVKRHAIAVVQRMSQTSVM